MKICLYTENYYKGGVDTFIVNLLNSWPNAEDEFILCCNQTHPGKLDIKNRSSRLIKIVEYSSIFSRDSARGKLDSTLKNKFIYIVYKAIYLIAGYPILFPYYLYRQCLFFKKSDYDQLLVINGGYPASLLCRTAIIAWRLSGKSSKPVLNFHSMAIKNSLIFSFFDYLIDRAIINSAYQIIGVSAAAITSLKSRVAFYGCQNIAYIHNGISDPFRLGDGDFSVSLSHASEVKAPYFLMLSTHTLYKGHEFLLKAFRLVLKECPHVNLYIYGHGSDEEKNVIYKIIKSMGMEGNVRIYDFCPDVTPLIIGAEAVLVPSQAYESFGLVVLEAFACRTPVVATNIGGIPEIIENSNAGFLCSKNDFFEFSECIKKILKDKNLKLNMGNNGRKHYLENFSSAVMARKYYEIVIGGVK